MTVTLSPQTETLLSEQAQRTGQDTNTLADALLQEVLADAARHYEDTVQAIAEGLADVEAGRTVSFTEARARWGAQKAARLQPEPRSRWRKSCLFTPCA